jgi:serine/threonine protein kinase
MTQNDTTRHNTARHDTTRHDTTRHNTTRHNTQAVNYLHCSSPPVVHTKLTPINVLLDGDMVAKLSDYGLGFTKTKDGDRMLRQTNGYCANPVWIAPEVLSSSRECSKASDVYSFGVILWELMCREKPFKDQQGAGGVRVIKEICAGAR